MKTILSKVALIPLISIICCIFLTSHNLFSQNQIAKVTPGDTWYYEYLPSDYNANTDKYPIMFFFHGLGERGNVEADLPKVAKNGPPLHVKNGTDFPFILISPQLKTSQGNWPPNYMDEVVEHILQSGLRIDLNRVYISGLSLGGGGAWFYAQRFPEKIAAVAPVCGSRNNTGEACNIAAENIPVWAFHGDSDGTVSVNKTINMVNAINACVPAINPTAKITIYEGVGHNSWSRAFKTDNSLHTPNIYEWFMLQSKASLTVGAGADKVVNLPTTSTNITATINSAKSIATKQWTKVSGPSGVSLQNATTNTLTANGLVEGIYVFRFSATDVDGGNATDDVKVTVVSSNSNPTASAGSDRQIQLPTSAATISGSGSDSDGTIASYLWTKVSGGNATLTNTDKAALNIADVVEGIYVFEIEVTDDKGAAATDQMKLTILAASNASPTADAGADQTLQLPTNSINLAGSGSDPDGTIQTYAWEKVNGGPATLTNSDKATVTISGLEAGVYEFRLTVTDDDGATDPDKMQLTVSAANQSPSVSVTKATINITLPTSSTTLSASVSDADGSIASVLWEQESGPLTATINSASTNTTNVNGLTDAGDYVFTITAIDDKGASKTETVTVKVANEPINSAPEVNAGVDKFLSLPTNSINITATASDSDGSISSLLWTKTVGPAVSMQNATELTVSLSNLLEGTYKFKLTATDDKGLSTFDEVGVLVAPEDVNSVPSVSAGNDQEITLPKDSVSLLATASDEDGTIASYFWSQSSGPASAVLSGENSSNLKVGGLLEGTYTFTVTVEDDAAAQASGDVSILVGAQNILPNVNAGSDITITLPLDSISVEGTANDNDGLVTQFNWTIQNGPNAPTIQYSDSSLLKVVGLVSGNYIFRLTATDNSNETAFDDLKVTVNEADNQAPSVITAADVEIQLPVDAVNLSAAISDPDGTIASIKWDQVSGPSAAVLTNATTKTVTAASLLEGTYILSVTAIDDKGAEGIDEVQVIVIAEAQNIAPTITVEDTETINLPTNSIVLAAIVSDTDGSIVSYLWKKASGPSAVLSNDSTTALTVQELVAGSYVFELTVKDNVGAIAKARVQVFVLPEDVNQSPVANAGSNQLIILPQTQTTIVGTGIDNDGTVVSYLWEKLSGPDVLLENTTNSTLTVKNLVEGELVLRLTVTDNDGASASDEMLLKISVEAVNLPPNANAGGDLSTILPVNSLIINGTGTDQDGTVIAYKWSKVAGPAADLSNVTTTTLIASNLSEGVYEFQFKVTDNSGAMDVDKVKVYVFSAETNKGPTVNAGNDKTIQLPTNQLTVTATANDSDGTIAVMQWKKVSGGNAVLADTNMLALKLSGLEEGIYKFKFTATDDDDASASDEVTITVNAEDANQAPVIEAGVDQVIQLPLESTNVTATASDPDGDPLVIRWSKVSGPIVTISNSDQLNVQLTNLQEGDYIFKVTATDNEGLVAEDQVKVEVLSGSLVAPPQVDAGTVATIQLPTDEVILEGNAESAGTIASTEWEQLDGPAVAILSGINTLSLKVSGLLQGKYVFRLTALDNVGQSAFDETEVIVYPEEEIILPQPPSLEVDEEILVQLPTDLVEVAVNAISPDGLITNYTWEQLTGPTDLIISPDSVAVVEITNFQEGVYYMLISVSDANDSTVSKSLRMTVLGAEDIARPRKVFTPNNDGVDDLWKIEGAEALSTCAIKVIDRHGKQVYATSGYANEWDGKYQNGTDAPAGLYFYIIGCSSLGKELKGAITLIR
ncbi:MAG: gliding motility-associated-like protein [Marivirga sp.]|jgi:gliding motility-associated-like protein